LSFPHNLGAFAPWREEFPTPSTFDARLFAQAAQIFNYSNTKSTKFRGQKRRISRHHFARAAQTAYSDLRDLRDSFENGIKEGSLTSFEMTRIVIPNECEESFPSIFILCGRVQLMNHFVVKKRLSHLAAASPR
jgi:hypothetical protein